MNLPVKTIEDIRGNRPCYDPVTGRNKYGDEVHPGGFLPEDWEGTALDILAVEACPPEDRLWVVLHRGWLSDQLLRRFTHRLYEYQLEWYQAEVDELPDGEREQLVELVSRIKELSRRWVDSRGEAHAIWYELNGAVIDLHCFLHKGDGHRWDWDCARRIYAVAWDTQHSIAQEAAHYAYGECVLSYAEEVRLLKQIILEELEAQP